MNWSPGICKFSPLRTPHVKAAKKKHSKLLGSPKLKTQEGIVSDVESVASCTTRDIRALARSVQDKMGRMSTLDSDEDLFITQSFDKTNSKLASVSKPSNVKTKRKPHAVSDSELDSDSSSSAETHVSESVKDSTERVSIVDSQDDLFSSQPSNEKTKRKPHAVSGSELDSDSSSSAETHVSESVKDSTERVGTVDNEEDFFTAQTSVKKGSQPADVKERKKQNVKSIKKYETDSELESSTSESDLSDSEPERDTKSSKKSNQSATAPTAVAAESPTLPQSQQSDDTTRPMRFKIPEHFEMKPPEDIVPIARLKGKEIWLFSTPADFDISTLDGQTLNLERENLVKAANESEKQWEVTCFPNFQDQLQTTSLCTVAADGQEMDTLSIGPEVSGQVLVMNWVPTMPAVQLKKQAREKHSVPDNLKPTFTPFGANAPVRYHNAAEVSPKKTKGKKRHKERRDSMTEVAASKKAKLSDSFGLAAGGDSAQVKVGQEKVKKSKRHTMEDMGNDDVTIKIEGCGDGNEAVDSVESEKTESQQAKKKKKKKKQRANDEENNISNNNEHTDLTGDVNTSVVQSEGLEKIKKKKKKHKKHEEVKTEGADNDGTDLVIGDDDGTSANVSEKKKKKKKKHKQHDVMETDIADFTESKVKSKKKKKHKDQDS